MPKAFLRKKKAFHPQAQLSRLVQQFLGLVGRGEIPKMLLACEGVGNAQKRSLFAAVAGHVHCGHSVNVNVASGLGHQFHHIINVAQFAGTMQVNLYFSAAKVFNRALKGLVHLAGDGLRRIDLRHYKSYRLVTVFARFARSKKRGQKRHGKN